MNRCPNCGSSAIIETADNGYRCRSCSAPCPAPPPQLESPAEAVDIAVAPPIRTRDDVRADGAVPVPEIHDEEPHDATIVHVVEGDGLRSVRAVDVNRGDLFKLAIDDGELLEAVDFEVLQEGEHIIAKVVEPDDDGQPEDEGDK